jgi:hypothetical protein
VWLAQGAINPDRDRLGARQTTTYLSRILEYAHGGTKPIKTLSDANGYAFSCAFDPATGDLALLNWCSEYIESSCDGNGSIDIYRNERGQATAYTAPDFNYYYYGAYDQSGDLFFDGASYSSGWVFAEMLKNKTIKKVSLDQEFMRVEGVQWLGAYLGRTFLAVADADAGDIYEFSLRGNKGTETNATPISDEFNGVFGVRGNKVVVDNYRSGFVAFYGWPGGGSPIRSFNLSGARALTISIAARK